MEHPLDALVHAPAHYNQGSIEAIDAIREVLGADGFVAFCRGNALKYMWRMGHKGEPTQDAEKAAVYLRWAVDALNNAPLTKSR